LFLFVFCFLFFVFCLFFIFYFLFLTGGLVGVFGDIGNFLGDVATGGALSNSQATADVNAQNIAFAQQQEQYQTQMSDTSYQRGVSDMRAAGLNPMLAYSQGGDSTPTGVSPDIQSTQPGNIGAGLANTAGEVATGVPDIQKTNADTVASQKNAGLIDAATNKTTANAAESYANISNTNQDTSNKFTQGQILNKQDRIAKEGVRKAKADADSSEYDRDEGKMSRDIQQKRYGFDKGAANWDAGVERAQHVTGVIGNAFGAADKGLDLRKRVRNNW
jgi:hypothetical protein